MFPSQGLVALKTWGQRLLLCLLLDAWGGQAVFPKGLLCPEAAAYRLAGHSTPPAGRLSSLPSPLPPRCSQGLTGVTAAKVSGTCLVTPSLDVGVVIGEIP